MGKKKIEEGQEVRKYWLKVAEEEKKEEEQREKKRQKEKKGSFVIRIGDKGMIASHLITVEAISEDKWFKPFLMDFIKKKVKEIDDFWQAEIELLNAEVQDRTEIEVGIYIAGVGESETIKQWTRKWLENRIGSLFCITKLEVKAVSSLARISDRE